MIADITGIDYELLRDNIILETNELSVERKNEKAKRCDFILRISDDNIINLEINRQSYTGLIVKNLSYVFRLFSTAFKKGENYNDNLIVTQINLNCFKGEDYEEVKPLSKYHLREDDDNKLYAKNLVIYDLNVVKCHELYYNKRELDIPNYVRWGALIYNNKLSEIPNILKEVVTYEELKIIMGKLDKLTHDDLFMSEEDNLKWIKWEENTIFNDGVEQGIEQGIDLTIKNMLNKGMKLDDISEITGKSIEEIKELMNK